MDQLVASIEKLSGVETQAGSCRIVGVLASWCSVCTQFKPYFLNAQQVSSGWDAAIRPELCWIDGDDAANEAALKAIGIDYESFPSFWIKQRDSDKWEPVVDRRMVADVTRLRAYCEQLVRSREEEEEEKKQTSIGVAPKPIGQYYFVPRLQTTTR